MTSIFPTLSLRTGIFYSVISCLQPISCNSLSVLIISAYLPRVASKVDAVLCCLPFIVSMKLNYDYQLNREETTHSATSNGGTFKNRSFCWQYAHDLYGNLKRASALAPAIVIESWQSVSVLNFFKKPRATASFVSYSCQSFFLQHYSIKCYKLQPRMNSNSQVSSTLS
jgi:hypothetical protein